MIDMQEIQSTIDTVTSEFGINDASINAAKFLIGCAYFGQDVDALSVNLGIPHEEILSYAENARSNGIWGADGRVYAEWAEEPMSFMLDLMVITGVLERSTCPSEVVTYGSEIAPVLPWVNDD